uniref:Uncharacterized protein n=1 Tax=Setaria digitata TaxID=48799 RepID=A0A915PKG2_9BILA
MKTVLAVLPSTVEHISMMKSDPVSQFLVMFCVYLRLLNSFNMVVLFFYRQKDFRRTAIQGLKWLFYGRKRHIMPTVTGFIP